VPPQGGGRGARNGRDLEKACEQSFGAGAIRHKYDILLGSIQPAACVDYYRVALRLGGTSVTMAFSVVARFSFFSSSSPSSPALASMMPKRRHCGLLGWSRSTRIEIVFLARSCTRFGGHLSASQTPHYTRRCGADEHADHFIWMPSSGEPIDGADQKTTHHRVGLCDILQLPHATRQQI
jgi:hypothetical protein